MKSLILAGLLLATSAEAQDLTKAEIQEKRRQLNDKRAELLAHLDRVDDLGHAQGVYAAVRGKAMEGPKALPAQAKAWQEGAAQWIGGWEAMMVTVDGATSTTATALRGAIDAALDHQAGAYEGLRAGSVAIVSEARRAEAALVEVETYPGDYAPGYEAHVQAFNQRVAELRASLKDFAAGFAKDAVGPWKELTEVTREALLSKLRAAALHYPELQASVTQAEQAFSVAAKIDPELAKVDKSFDAFADAHLANQFFHAKDALAALDTVAAAAKVAINASGLDAIFCNPAVQAIDNKVNTAHGMSAAPSPFTPGQRVATYVYGAQRLYTHDCKNAEKAKARNCDLLRTLNKFNPATVKAMTEADLRNLEFAFDQVAGKEPQ